MYPVYFQSVYVVVGCVIVSLQCVDRFASVAPLSADCAHPFLEPHDLVIPRPTGVQRRRDVVRNGKEKLAIMLNSLPANESNQANHRELLAVRFTPNALNTGITASTEWTSLSKEDNQFHLPAIQHPSTAVAMSPIQRLQPLCFLFH